MDGAISKNPTTLTSREAKRAKKAIVKDGATAEKHVSKVRKALKFAEKDEGDSEKVAKKALRARDKAVKEEYKAAQVLGEAQHKHELALAGEAKAVRNLSMHQRHLQEAHRTVDSWRTELEQARRKKDDEDIAREERLYQIRTSVSTGSDST